jgi:transaldolase
LFLIDNNFLAFVDPRVDGQNRAPRQTGSIRLTLPKERHVAAEFRKRLQASVWLAILPALGKQQTGYSMNQLDQLRAMSAVVADTGDIEAIARYQPVDATTNPSLLLKAAMLPQYEDLISKSAEWVRKAGIAKDEQVLALGERFAVEIGCEILKIVPGRVSTEIDARLSFDAAESIAMARRIAGLYADAGIERDRILIKLASTWESIQAAATLEQDGINCNLTLLFSDVQAVAAAKAGAFLISPFVGRILDWHKKTEGRDSFTPDEDPGVASVRNIYRLFKARGFETIVMGASFRNADEIRALAGCDRLTISPNFLEELEADTTELPRVLSASFSLAFDDCDFEGEADFRQQLNSNAMATEKLAEGIRGFVADQVKLEALLSEKL